jgi:metal-responsive CopG/Arc/MetJ family transcriptional regulator
VGRPPLDRAASNTARRLIAFPNSLLKRINAWAKKHGINDSEAIRRLVDTALEAEKKRKK